MSCRSLNPHSTSQASPWSTLMNVLGSAFHPSYSEASLARHSRGRNRESAFSIRDTDLIRGESASISESHWVPGAGLPDLQRIWRFFLSGMAHFSPFGIHATSPNNRTGTSRDLLPRHSRDLLPRHSRGRNRESAFISNSRWVPGASLPDLQRILRFSLLGMAQFQSSAPWIPASAGMTLKRLRGGHHGQL